MYYNVKCLSLLNPVLLHLHRCDLQGEELFILGYNVGVFVVLQCF